MKVYILFKDIYEGREVAGVYRSLREAQARFPHVVWRADEWPSYEEGPPRWRGALDDHNIEAHELR